MGIRRSRRAPAWALAAMVSMASVVLSGAPGYAEPDADQIAMGVEATAEVRATVAGGLAKARGELASAQGSVDEIDGRLDAARATLKGITDRAAKSQARVTEMDRQLQTKDEEVTELRNRLQRAATQLWIAQSGAVVDESPSDAYLATVRRDRYGRAAGEVPRELIVKFKQQRKALETLRDRADDERAAIEVERRAAEQTVATATTLSAIGHQALSVAQAKVARWESLSTAPETPVMSKSLLSAAEIAGWFRSTGRHERLGTDEKGGPMDIEKLAAYFLEEGQRYGIRGDIAFAQAIHETGYFSFPDFGQVRPGDNNFAGIGACNSCDRGYQYPNARVGARAQMQLLRVYADPKITEAGLPDGDKALFSNYDNHIYHGMIRYWTDLNGRWAVPGTTYGQAIQRTYLMIVAWAIDHMTYVAPPKPAAKPAPKPAPTTTTAPGGSAAVVRPATPVGQ